MSVPRLLHSQPLIAAPLMGDEDHGRPFFIIEGEFDPNEGAIPLLKP